MYMETSVDNDDLGLWYQTGGMTGVFYDFVSFTV